MIIYNIIESEGKIVKQFRKIKIFILSKTVQKYLSREFYLGINL